MSRRRAIVCFGLLLGLAACAQKQAPVPSASTVPLPPPPPRGEPDQFTGLSAASLRAELGNPAFVRKDGATEMWRYDSKACHAYFFLGGVAQEVQHVETLPQGRSTAADPACLQSLKQAPGAKLFPGGR
jgi:hypothetical protein